MKQDILFEYSRKAGFPTGTVLAYYDLSGIVYTDNETDRDRHSHPIRGPSKATLLQSQVLETLMVKAC